MRCVVGPTVMHTPDHAAALASLSSMPSPDRPAATRRPVPPIFPRDRPAATPPPRGGLTVLPVTGWPIGRGDAVARRRAGLLDGDVVVVTQKIVSKSEGAIVPIDPDDPDDRRRWSSQESVRVLRRRGDLVITETRHGFVCANAGVDLSNVDAGWAALLPQDPDRSARRIRDGLRAATGATVAVVVSDTFGRTWRQGVTDVAIGCRRPGRHRRPPGDRRRHRADPRRDRGVRGRRAGRGGRAGDGQGRGIPVAVVRGVDPGWLRPGSVAAEIVRPPSEDLFR